MSYYEDLSIYSYSSRPVNNGKTLNVGWLNKVHTFHTEIPSKTFLDALWNISKISVVQTRGVHLCDICQSPSSNQIEWMEEALLLGSAEIRAFSSTSDSVFSAPNLLFHYISTHHYRPPQEFIDSVIAGPHPPKEGYFELLRRTGLEWNLTTPITQSNGRYKPGDRQRRK